MTCIVGIIHESRVWLGADSAASDNWALEIRRDRKVFRLGESLIGYSDSYRMGQLLEHAFEPPQHPDGEGTMRYLVTRWGAGVRDGLRLGGWLRKENEREEGGNFIVGYRGRLFTVYSDFQVAEAEASYAACGSGFLIALGALSALAGVDMSAMDRIHTALGAAERHSAHVRRPFHVISDQSEIRGELR